MNYTKDQLLLIWLDSFIGLEYKHKKALYEEVKGNSEIKSFLEKSKEYIKSSIGEKTYNTLLASASNDYLKYLIDEYSKKGVRLITIIDEEYPKLLRQTEIPPLVLYTVGDLKLLNEKTFSIVGSRKCLPVSKELAKSYAKDLVENGYCLVTGTAEGVDTAVIESALSNGGKVISVVAGGIDNVYPTSNTALIERVKKQGLVISEYPPEVKAMPYFFPLRNRIIAGLSKGTLIVSAKLKSGTMYTAEYANVYGRDVFAIPYGVGVESGAGCNDLIKRGAILTDSVDDILDFYGETKKQKIILTPLEKEIFDVLTDGEKHLEQISEKLSKQIFEISPIISMMEIKGIVYKAGNNVFGLLKAKTED